MKTQIRYLFKSIYVMFVVASVFAVLIPIQSHAAIAVNPGDVTGGEYSYVVDYNNYSRAVTDAETKINFTYMQWADGTRYSYAQNYQSFAQLVLHWDFSGSGFAPNSVSLSDRTTLFTNTANDRTEAVVEYSINGTNWFEVDTQITPDYPYNTTSVVKDDWTNVVLGLGTGDGITDFYYRLTMNTLTDGCSSGNTARCDTNGTFSNYQNQWSRANPGVTTFNATFSNTVVPEPISSTLFIVGAATLGFRRFRRKFTK